MAISNTSPATSTGISATGTKTATTTSVTGSSTSIANNFDQFLTLLTTQLKNQSPLDPLDTNQFTAQLVQFAGVEQQLKTNDTLASLLTLNKTSATTNAVGYLGSTITADGATTPMKDGVAAWKVTSPRAGTGTITIKNEAGTVVQSTTAALSAGSQTYQWDGTTSTGIKAPSGNYTITIDARDVSAQAMTATTEISGVVDGVDLTGDQPMLKIGLLSVALDKVKSLVKAP